MALDTVITYAKRTAVGKFCGAFKQTSAPQLGAYLVKDALSHSKLAPELIEEIIMGQVLTAGVGQAPARQTAIYGGLPKHVSATTVSKVCGSGLKSIMLADQGIRSKDVQLVLAGGQENMSLAPHLMPASRSGYRFGSFECKDHMQMDGLWDPYNNIAMGSCAEVCAKQYQFTKEMQDQYALRSYEKARKAIADGFFKEELLAMSIAQGKSQVLVDQDEEPFSVDLEKIRSLRPAFEKDGTISAGSASSINDGAALMMLTTEDFAAKNNMTPLVRIVAQASFAQDPLWFTTAPIMCIKKLLQKANLKIEDIDLFEINEAFALVAMAAIKDLHLDEAKVNIHGGAVALGHPIGASGSRVLVTLIHSLMRYGKKRGLATLCVGGGEAVGVIIERL